MDLRMKAHHKYFEWMMMETRGAWENEGIESKREKLPDTA